MCRLAHRDPETSDLCALTRFEQGVESFDNIFEEGSGEKLNSDHCFALANAAETLIFLHKNGFIHKDYQVKNTAADTIGARLIDISSVEKKRRFSVPDLNPYVENLRAYIRSLGPYVRPTQANVETVNEYFLDLYRKNTDEIFPRQLQTAVDFKLNALEIEALLARP